MTQDEPKKILIVDDEEDLALLLKLTFEKQGYSTVIAKNGREALEIVKSMNIDAVVTDIRMPEGDGVEFLEHVRSFSPEKPVIVLVTGFSDLTVDEAFDKGAQSIFTKPVDRKAVVRTVERFLSKDRLSPKDSKRVPTNLSLTLAYPPSFAVKSDGIAVNMGRGGAFVFLNGTLPRIGDEIEFTIVTEGPPQTTISGVGVCKWIRECNEDGLNRGFGLEFIVIDRDGEARIGDIIDKTKTRSYIPKG